MIYHWLVSASFKFILIIEINYRVPKSLAGSIHQLNNNTLMSAAYPER